MAWHLNFDCKARIGRVVWGCAGDGPPLVLAHGWPWSSYSWHRVIPALSRSFTVYWYDMPGFGRSAKALDQPTGLDAQGEVMCDMLDHWGLERPSIWAHDFGGAVSLRAHLLHGRDLDRYVLMNVVAMRPWGSDFFDHVARHIDAFFDLPANIHAAIVSAYIESALVAPLDAEDRSALEAPWLDEDGQIAFYRQFGQAEESLTAVLEPRLGDVARPVHVLWGTQDPWIPLDRGRALADGLGCGLTEMAGLGHLPQLEDPDRVLDMALPHLMPEGA